MTEPRRWDGDARLVGVRDALEAAPPVRLLLEAMADGGWVAEQPEHHLLPHLRAASGELGVELVAADTIDDVLVVRIALEPARPREARHVVFSLLGAIAEQSTHVRQDGDAFMVVTGSVDGDEPFKPHGHLLRILVG